MRFSLLINNKQGRYYSISSPTLGEYVCPWSNGKYGSIIDLYDADVLRFIDYYYEPGDDSKDEVVLERHHTEEERKQCPVVAEGVIVYWLKWCTDHALQYDIAQIFDDYYDKCFRDYERWQQRKFDYWKYKSKLPLDFAKKHLNDEMGRIAKSKVLSEYLTPQDYAKISELTQNYIEYVRDKIKQLDLSPSGIELKVFSEGHNTKKIISELKRIDLTGFGQKQFVSIARDFFISIGWLQDTSKAHFLKWMKQNKIVSVKADKLENVPINEKTNEMIDKLQNTFQRLNAHGNWEDKQEFYLPGFEKINQG